MLNKISTPNIFTITVSAFILLAGCSKSDGTGGGGGGTTPPVVSLSAVSTASVGSITQISAVSGGTVTSEGNGSVTARGVVWNTTGSPTTADSKTTDGTGAGVFVSTMTGLSAGTTYFVRSYATNSAGTAYGSQVTFVTLAAPGIVIPTLTTTAVSAVLQTTATSGGNITSDGGGTVSARGVAWSTSANPTVTNSITTNGTGTGIYTSSLTGLASGTTYFVRAYATNAAGTAYGNQVTFTTTGAATFNISISGFAFSPATLTVHTGDIIKWTNNDPTTHTVTSDDNTTFNSGGLGTTSVFTYTASATGTFPYHCAIHPGMTASITVIP